MMRLFRRHVGALFIAGLLAFFAAGCSGGAGVATSPAAPQSNVAAPRTLSATSATGNVTFTIGIARKVSTSQVTPKFVSPSTQSLRILTDGSNPVLLNLTASSPNCSPNPAAPGALICRASLTVPAGNHVFTVSAYGLVNAGGTVLSSNTSGSVFVKPTGTTAVPIVLEGFVQRVTLTLTTTNPPVGKAAAIGLTPVLEDADGNLIVGPASYEYPVTLTTTDPVNGALSRTTLKSPADASGITVAYSGADVSSVIFSANATGLLAARVTAAVLTPSGVGARKIYVTNNLTNTLTTYNAAGVEIAPRITAGLNNPFGVAVDASGKIYVANGNLEAVTTYNADGSPSTPTFTANLIGPEDVAVDEAGLVYVANPSQGNVQLFNASGSLFYSFTDGLSVLSFPASVAVHAGNLYVANTNSSTIEVYNVSGQFDGVPKATITANLNNPNGVAVDTAGKIYVANAGNNTITTYNTDGSASTPTIRAGVNVPSAVAVDRAGKIYVSNHGNNTVTTFNADGSQTSPTITGLSGANGIAVQ